MNRNVFIEWSWVASKTFYSYSVYEPLYTILAYLLLHKDYFFAKLLLHAKINKASNDHGKYVSNKADF